MPDNPQAAAKRLFRDHVVWDDHSGFGPSPSVDLNKLAIWKDAGVDYLSIDVGYDVMDWRDTVKIAGRLPPLDHAPARLHPGPLRRRGEAGARRRARWRSPSTWKA